MELINIPGPHENKAIFSHVESIIFLGGFPDGHESSHVFRDVFDAVLGCLHQRTLRLPNHADTFCGNRGAELRYQATIPGVCSPKVHIVSHFDPQVQSSHELPQKLTG